MKLPFTFDASRTGVDLPTEFSSRDEALRSYKAGKLSRLNFGITAYVHDPAKIKNPVVLNEAELEAFAASFVGCPFLADHSRNQSDRGGTITESSLVEKNGKKAIYQRIDAVKPWAVEGALDGTVDRFSIGWWADEYACTVCNAEYGGDDCRHDYWDLGKKDKTTGERVKVLMRGLEGQETSAVTHPAVPGTEASDSLASLRQLSETRKKERESIASDNSVGAKVKEDRMKEQVYKLLGLSDTTAEPEALTALEARLRPQKPEVPKAMLAALGLPETASEDEAIAKVVGLTAPGNVVPKAEHDKLLDELATYKAKEMVEAAKMAGKITPATSAWALDLAKRQPEMFEKYIATAPVQVPLATNTPAPIAAGNPGGSGSGLTEDELTVARRIGKTPEQFAKDKQALAEYETRISSAN